MIVVDSSVWIDYFNNVSSIQTSMLDALLDDDDVAVTDLGLAEVLQGFRTEREAERAQELLAVLDLVELGGHDAATQAAANYRALRRLGAAVRSTIDTLIATACIRGGHVLLHNDRDFDAFEEHLGLQVLR